MERRDFLSGSVFAGAVAAIVGQSEVRSRW